MNEDYLWDKTGSDDEIEGLENMLSAFRYQETEAPALPAANIVTVAEKAPWWRFSLGFAFAGAMALVVLGIGLFWLMPRATDVAIVPISKPAATTVATTDDSEVTHSNLPDIVASKTRPTITKPAVRVVFKQPKGTTPAIKTVAKKVEIKDLTTEEKFAYGQLMLALSITGSKLKVVQDTIDGVENNKASDKQNFR